MAASGLRLGAGGLEQGNDLALAAPPRMGQRRHAVAVGQVHVGPAVDQEPHDLLVARPPSDSRIA